VTLRLCARYDPYGRTQIALNEDSSNASELGYTSALRLSGNLLYLKARVYDAEARVFLQADGVDRYRYAYVRGDPANFSDPWGMAPRNEAAQNPVKSFIEYIQQLVDGISTATFQAADNTGVPQVVTSVAEQLTTGWAALANEKTIPKNDKDAILLMGFTNAGDGAPEGFTRNPGEAHDSKTGFDAVSFTRDSDGQVFGVFGGTKDGKDAGTDALGGGLGLPVAQFDQAVGFARSLSRETEGSAILAGHSLGGGLASLAAVNTGLAAVTANAMGIRESNLDAGQRVRGMLLVRSYYVVGDALSTGQAAGELSGVAPTPLGLRIPLSPVPGGWNGVTRGAMLHGLKEAVWPAVGIKSGF
jgi:RHS repeat-associated protein